LFWSHVSEPPHLLRVRYLHQQLLESLEQHLIKERTRIARELHDSLAARIFQGMMFRLKPSAASASPRQRGLAHHLDVAIQRGLAAINEGRQTVSELRASGLWAET